MPESTGMGIEDEQAVQVKVIRGTPGHNIPHTQEAMYPKSELQLHEAAKTKERIVTMAIESARDAEHMLEEAVLWISIIKPAQRHQSLLTQIRQFVKETEEL